MPGASDGVSLIVLNSPKGGTGKSSLARHLLVSAVQNGIEAIGIDFDKQGKFLQMASSTRKDPRHLP